VETIRSIQLWMTTAALSLAPLFFGSVDQLWMAVWVVVLSIGTLCGAARSVNVWQRRVLYGFLIVCGAYAVVAVLQVTPDFIPSLGDPIWRRASELLGTDFPSRISSRAEIPMVAVGHFLIAVTSFMSGFFVGTSRRDSDVLAAFARYSILLYAIYGLLALAFTPNLLLWTPKLAYFGSLTATFVNHNTAATFIGTGVILWLCSALRAGQSLPLSSLRLLLLTPSNEQIAFKLILYASAGLVCFFALLLTFSRGGLICSCLGLLAAIGLMVASRFRSRLWYLLGLAGLALVGTLAWLSQTSHIGSEGLFDDGRWSVYGYCIQAIREHPMLGVGLGTFADFFPSLRASDFNRGGVWEQAHSTVLEIFVEMGIPVGACVVIAAVISLFILGRGALKSKDSSRSFLAATSGIAVLTYFHAMIDFSLQIPGYSVVFFILLGCGVAGSTAEQTKTRDTRLQRFTAAPKALEPEKSKAFAG
jgi:O-antigen ligase